MQMQTSKHGHGPPAGQPEAPSRQIFWCWRHQSLSVPQWDVSTVHLTVFIKEGAGTRRSLRSADTETLEVPSHVLFSFWEKERKECLQGCFLWSQCLIRLEERFRTSKINNSSQTMQTRWTSSGTKHVGSTQHDWTCGHLVWKDKIVQQSTQRMTPDLRLSVPTSVRLSVHLSVCPSIRPSICLSVLLSIHSSVHPSFCLSGRPSVHLSVLPSVLPSIPLSLCPSVPLVCLDL